LLEPGLDLEADLSIDSIKRTEIAGELAARLGIAAEEAGQMEELSGVRTAEGIASLLAARLGTTAPAAAPAPADAGTPARDVPVLETVREVVAERTGYPVDMLEPGLDLEADLSIDSIKRTEIAGELGVRLALDAAEADLEALGGARTVAALSALLEAALRSGPATAGPSGPPPAPAVEGPRPEITAPQRLLFTEHTLEPVTARPEPGRRVQLLGGGETATELSALLAEAGVETELVPDGAPPAEGAETVVHLTPLDTEGPVLPGAFALYQRVLAAGPRRLLTADRRGAGPPSGLRGFFRTVAREYPGTHATLAEVPDGASAAEAARALFAELAAPEDEPVVLLGQDGRRHAPRLRPTPLGPLATSGAGPAGDGAAEAEAVGLDRESVVLLVGGARGITARFARALAVAARCRLVLFGRTPHPAATEDPATAAATDRASLRGALLAARLTTTPAETERRASAILAEREVRATLAALREAGGEAEYQQVDVVDTEAVRAAVKQVYAQYGRLDGLVCAAGLIEDKLIAEKTPESFARVFSTKADGARTVLDAVDRLPVSPRFAVLFGSIAAALGNRGQSDYAAANDVLEELGRRWSGGERRGLTVHWGPWAASETGGGMVGPELMRSYAARGIKLIDLEEGPLSLLRELAYGAPDEHTVVYTASGW
ncbi:SDR family NAD(P)-dependent oxidoreductase, partial [Streptomyces sp. NPDC059096]|uniref:SDR family NAD(P)-dependent oxidoreductase n=1 Tax=Streptomyces sp. NPDC059096 TaxID=3346727 RepID=UPI003678E2D0